MRLWLVACAMSLVAACSGPSADGPVGKEPKTAKEKQHREAEAKGELDGPSSKWGGWRYTGARDECFFVVGRKCFKTAEEACAQTPCKTGCAVTGGGPATVACATAKK